MDVIVSLSYVVAAFLLAMAARNASPILLSCLIVYLSTASLESVLYCSMVCFVMTFVFRFLHIR